MDEYEDHINNIKLNHDIYSCKIRTLKDIRLSLHDCVQQSMNLNLEKIRCI
jgi:hypothetical protein